MRNSLLISLVFMASMSCAQTPKTETKMEKKPMEVFQAFGQAMMSGTDAWKNFIADDMVFIGPIDRVEGKEAFVQLNESFMPAIRGNNMVRMAESGDFVITQTEMQVATQTDKVITLDMSEWYEIKDGKIQSLKVYYDADEFRQEMGMKQ